MVEKLSIFRVIRSEMTLEDVGCWIRNPGVARSSRAGGALSSFSPEEQ